MTNKINSISNIYTQQVYSAINTKRNNLTFRANSEEQATRQISELPNTVNDSGVKVPLSYVKTDEKELPYGLKAHFYKLSNGQKVVIIPKEGKTVIKSYVNTGSLNEPDNIGQAI